MQEKATPEIAETRLSLFTGEFVDAGSELAFRKDVRETWLKRVKTIVLVALFAHVISLSNDYLLLGAGTGFNILVVERLSAIVVGLGYFWLIQRNQSVRVWDYGMLLFALLLISNFLTSATLREDGLRSTLPIAILGLCVIYISPVTRAWIAYVSSGYLTMGMLLVGYFDDKLASTELFVPGMQLFVTNLVVYFLGRRFQTEARRAWLGRRELVEHEQEQHALALQLQAANNDLARSHEELQKLAYVTSHDLKEPMRTLISYTSLLKRNYGDKFDSNARDYVEHVHEAAQRLHELINDLLDYTRINDQLPQHVDCDLWQLCELVQETLAETIRLEGAVITCHALPKVKVNPLQLTVVMQHLLANALEFHGKSPPRIQISAERKPGSWEISVADNGSGIPPEHAEHIFDVFQRLQVRDQHPGNGIGLAICRRIIEQHGGRIWVDPNQPCGSAFRFTLPCEDAGESTHHLAA